MSWERTEYKEVAPCACGKGTIVRLAYTEDDDWNRSRSGIINEKIACENCRTQYHIEHVIRHYSCPSWKGDGISDKAYLVPNSLTIPEQISEKHFSFNVEEEIVSIYSYDEIKAAKADIAQGLNWRTAGESFQSMKNVIRRKGLPQSLICYVVLNSSTINMSGPQKR